MAEQAKKEKKNAAKAQANVNQANANQIAEINDNHINEQHSQYMDEYRARIELTERLMPSKYKGSDGNEMLEVKKALNKVNLLLSEEISLGDIQYKNQIKAVAKEYDKLIAACDVYLEGHGGFRRKVGRLRRNLVKEVKNRAIRSRRKAAFDLVEQYDMKQGLYHNEKLSLAKTIKDNEKLLGKYRGYDALIKLAGNIKSKRISYDTKDMKAHIDAVTKSLYDGKNGRYHLTEVNQKLMKANELSLSAKMGFIGVENEAFKDGAEAAQLQQRFYEYFFKDMQQ